MAASIIASTKTEYQMADCLLPSNVFTLLHGGRGGLEVWGEGGRAGESCCFGSCRCDSRVLGPERAGFQMMRLFGGGLRPAAAVGQLTFACESRKTTTTFGSFGLVLVYLLLLSLIFLRAPCPRKLPGDGKDMTLRGVISSSSTALPGVGGRSLFGHSVVVIVVIVVSSLGLAARPPNDVLRSLCAVERQRHGLGTLSENSIAWNAG